MVLGVALHLGLVLLGAFGKLPILAQTVPLKVFRLWLEATGASNDYGYFAPGVGSAIRIDFVFQNTTGREIVEPLSSPDHELDLRLGSMMVGTMRLQEGQDLCARSLAAYALSRHAEAERVKVIAYLQKIPSMTSYRKGERPNWVEAYRGEFMRASPEP